jgi:excisionase family DNA binding protein
MNKQTYCQLPALPLITGQGADQFAPFSPERERLFNSMEAAEYLRCTPRTLCSFITAGKLKASWVGRQYLVSESRLKAFLNSQEK